MHLYTPPTNLYTIIPDLSLSSSHLSHLIPAFSSSTMKQLQYRFYCPILLILAILLAIHTVKASRALKEGSRDGELKKIEKDSFSNTTLQLIELENCETDVDHECVKRRMMDEAHLDYIYTQHHKP
ncbi:putative phytosulfokine [Dioscorea sansibarensis]